MSRCLSCEHIALFQEPIEGRGIEYVGACAHPAKRAVGSTQFCAATRNFAHLCQIFEPAAARALARACEADVEEVA